MSNVTVDPRDVPPDWAWVPPQILAIAGQPDPLISGPEPPNVELRLTAGETNTADLQRRVASLETAP
jgi:hypothetical protein